MADPHPMSVSRPPASPAIDPAARRAKRAFQRLAASTVGLELGVAVAISALFGMWLDGKFGTTPWLLLAGLVLGVVAGFRNVMRAVTRAERAAAETDHEDGHG